MSYYKYLILIDTLLVYNLKWFGDQLKGGNMVYVVAALAVYWYMNK